MLKVFVSFPETTVGELPDWLSWKTLWLVQLRHPTIQASLWVLIDHQEPLSDTEYGIIEHAWLVAFRSTPFPAKPEVERTRLRDQQRTRAYMIERVHDGVEALVGHTRQSTLNDYLRTLPADTQESMHAATSVIMNVLEQIEPDETQRTVLTFYAALLLLRRLEGKRPRVFERNL